MKQDDILNLEFKGGDTAKPINMRLRLDLINRYLPVKTENFLEIGCGRGGYLPFLEKMFKNVIGIEPNSEKLDSPSNGSKIIPGV